MRPAYLPTPRQLAQQLQPQLGTLMAQADMARYHDAWRHLEVVCLDYVVAALQQLGCPLQPGSQWTTAQLASQLGVVPVYQRLLGRLLEMPTTDVTNQPGGD